MLDDGLSRCHTKNMATVQSICVFCGSSAGHNPAHLAAAELLGREMAKSGIRLVYGGGSIGLMGAVARSVLGAGGEVTGIIPEFLVNRERMLEGVNDLVVVDDMHTRKRLMFEQSDAFVALPGGIGTLEEVVEQMTWAQLGRHAKPIVLANIDGFWDPLKDLLSHMADEAFIRPGYELRYMTLRDPMDIVPAIVEAASGYSETELEGNRASLERM
ncbi:LOG family protein ORF6 in fasciation locus [Hartmannibacter diazotrophicus]|uniref:Cytokinin riboside 5'-monophosphate phosphoribohydrolase n=2 Tax=Hartmannibacter diazotrophicus TaxID=1482074 RepID=A0A2C9D862_9HYPH|nr:LOG family protein ORF6 in fasciation locus [Hartmannibacter diazotrophicus]